MARVVIPVLSVLWLCLCNFALYFMNENSILKRVVKRRGRALLSSNQRIQPRPLEFFAWDIIDPHSAVLFIFAISNQFNRSQWLGGKCGICVDATDLPNIYAIVLWICYYVSSNQFRSIDDTSF